MNIYSLQPRELVHVDFFFMDIAFIREFSTDLIVVDAKTRYL